MEQKMGLPNPEPTTAPTPSVHTTPRPRTTFQVSNSEEPAANPDELLYPRWVTLVFRILFTAYDIAVLSVIIRFLVKWRGVLSTIGNPFPADRYSLAVGTVVVALVVDPIAVITSAANCYGTYRLWGWAVVFDAAVGIMGAVTPLAIAWVDHNGYSSEELGWFWEDEGDLIGLLVLG
ncbi:hypothetical protein OQA88_9374 [Cercophora sp. LCS_1]